MREVEGERDEWQWRCLKLGKEVEEKTREIEETRTYIEEIIR